MKYLQLFRLEKFKILFNALRNEPIHQVWGNLVRYLKNGPKSLNGSLRLAGANNEWIMNFDYAYISKYSSAVILSGWYVFKPNQNLKEIKINGENINIWYLRPDVEDSLGREYISASHKAGFYYIGMFVGQEQLTIELLSQDDKKTQQSIQLTEIESIEHLPLSRNAQYHPYVGIMDDETDIQHKLEYCPLISVILPVYNVSIDYLKPCIESVLNQSYENWELCICDDASHRIDTKAYLQSIANSDRRIKLTRNESNLNISESSNRAIGLAEGDFVCLLDHDDLLHRNALNEVVKVLNEKPETQIIYSDEDKLDKKGRRVEPYYKPQFSKHLLFCNNYICHLLVIRKSLGDKIYWFRKGYEGAQDHDLILRLIEHTNKIVHIPKVLYHWRKIEGSTALNASQKSYASKAGLNAVKDYFKRNSIKAKVKYGEWAGSYRVSYTINSYPEISIIIPFKDQVDYLKRCISSIFDKTIYPNVEIILVNNNSIQDATKAYLNSLSFIENINILEYKKEFNYSKINNYAIEKAKGDIILLLNNDIEVITEKWLSKLYSHLQNEGVGAVGAHLLYEDGTNQHNGVVLGIGGVAGHAFKGMDSRVFHYYLDGLSRDVSGCTAACLLFSKRVWKEVNGLNENDLKVAFNDVDFCLKIRETGQSIIFINEVKLYHFESKSRGYEDTPEKVARFKTEERYMKETWGDYLKKDPYYNPNLSMIRQDLGLNLEGAISKYLTRKSENG